MDLNEAAKHLVEACNGLATDENINSVASVLKTLEEVVNDRWEEWLTSDTNEILKYDRYRCRCGRDVEVERERQSVTAKLI